MSNESPVMLSIGALSNATGVPVETLRTWERRYGFPMPERTPSGHRRYALATVEDIRLAARALAQGHRPAAVMVAGREGLRQLLGVGRVPAEAEAGAAEGGVGLNNPEPVLVEWWRHVLRFDANGLDRALHREWSARGSLPFIEGALGPFLVDMGERWYRDELSIRHEHFASERLRDFLTGRWRPLSDTARGPRVVCATLAGERHVLGLHMAAVVLALEDVRVVFLGADTPSADIASAAHDFAASAVVLSISQATAPEPLPAQLAGLRRSLDPEVAILAGGTGLRETDEVVGLPDFGALQDRARSF